MHSGRVDPCSRGPHRRSSQRWRWLLLPSVAGLGACADGAMPAAAPAMAAPSPAAMADLAEGMPPPPAPPPAPPPPPPAPMVMAAPPPPAPGGLFGRAVAQDAPAEPLWAPVREFPAPSYAGAYDGPRSDFRETIFWKPSIQTDERGQAQVDFYLSDAVTSFRATIEGVSGAGQPGHGEAVIASKLPVSLATKLPLEVSSGDRIDLPVTLTNTTWRPYEAALTARFGPAFALAGDAPQKVSLRSQESRSYFYGLNVVGTGMEAGAGEVSLAVESAHLSDAMKRTIRVVPAGFPREQSVAGTLTGTVKQELDLPESLPGTLVAEISFYPSPKSTLMAGTEAMVREPTGCFEQASSANYPNVMVLGYVSAAAKPDPALVARTTELLDRGYKKIAGYESKGRGYEWFGGDPGHEALTAYGLMEFADMARVYKDVDATMVTRTAAWLKGRRDGKGGYLRSDRALDSFGRANEDVTNTYITYALTEVGERDLDAELAAVKKLAKTGTDTYVLALAAGALANVDREGAETRAALARLEGKQGKDGRFMGAAQSITMSGGEALEIETTALAALALMKGGPDHRRAVDRAVGWIEEQRSGWGGFGSTQSTVLALKALTQAASMRGEMPEGTLAVTINGAARSVELHAGTSETITLSGLAAQLQKGHNVIEIAPSAAGLSLPYAMKIGYRTQRPASSPKAPVSIDLAAPASAKVGEGVRVKVDVANTTGGGLPMVIARVGIPGGLAYQTWQLDELKKQGLVDFYETREREVIVYFRSMAPQAHKRFDLDLLATVPGSYTAPASQAYLYYTDEHRRFADPIHVNVTR
jgi:alpha-2-macroglobulin-like protein